MRQGDSGRACRWRTRKTKAMSLPRITISPGSTLAKTPSWNLPTLGAGIEVSRGQYELGIKVGGIEDSTAALLLPFEACRQGARMATQLRACAIDDALLCWGVFASIPCCRGFAIARRKTSASGKNLVEFVTHQSLSRQAFGDAA